MSDPFSLYRLTGEPAPESPVLVVALDGWVDAGLAGSTALSGLLETIETRLYAVFDPEPLIDQRARRPGCASRTGSTRASPGPSRSCASGRTVSAPVSPCLTGPEPDFRWKQFASSVVSLAGAMGVRLMVGFGGFPAAAPAHAADPPRLHRHLAAPRLSGRLRRRDDRRAGRSGGGAGGGARPGRHPGRRPVGEGAALRGGDAFPGCRRAAARRAGGCLRPRHRLERPRRGGGDRQGEGGRADRPELRARRHGPPARAQRRCSRRGAARCSARRTCRQATTLPLSWSVT